MTTQIQRRRGTTAQHSTFTGAEAEITVDTTKDTVVVHDGSTVGGRPLLREDQSNLPTTAPTTGIYNASGSLAISTNGTQRINIEADGDINIDNGGVFYDATNNRLAVGTTSPSYPLSIFNATNNFVQFSKIGDGVAGSLIGRASGSDELRVQNSENAPIAFFTNNLERARIDSSGRLLVGTSSARANLFNGTVSSLFQIEGIATTDRVISVISSSASDAPPNIVLGKQRSGSIGGNTIVASGDGVGVISFQGNDGSEFVEAVRISAEVDGTPGANDMPGRLVFSTTADGAASPTERMRITSGGYIKTSADGSYNNASGLFHEIRGNSTGFQTLRLENYNNTSGNGTYVSILGSNCNNTNSYHFVGNTGTTDRVLIYGNGNIQNSNGSYTTLSDAKLKENIVNASSQWDDLKAIQIRNWNFKAETGHETHRQIGPIAQELETVCPGLVFETPDRDADGNETGEVTKGVNQSVLYMKAVKALQEAMERIETLEQRLNDAGIN